VEPAEPPQLPLSPEPAPTRLVLVRHGQSTWNREHRIQGQLDPPLSPEGVRQAELLGQRLAPRRFAAFYASDLARAMETAELIGASIGQAPTPDQSLREIFLGDWEGLTTSQIAERFPEAWAAWVEEPDWDVVPGGEGAALFEARIAGAIDRIVQRHPDSDVLVVTHGGVIQVALHRIVGQASRGLFPFKIQNASISLIEKRSGRTIIGGVNDIAHLEAALVADVGPG
jgi:broad specificity phosphatase PhoE